MKRIINQKIRLENNSKFVILFVFIISLSSNIFATDQIVELSNGRKVILHSDKTSHAYSFFCP